MEAGRKRNIQSGEGYTDLFPKAEGENKTIRKNADVTHTVAFVPKVVNETLYQTKGISQRLKANNTYETCKNIWHFVYQHIAYRKDQEGYEQIRSPARAWHDRLKGVDCDCYSVFISSILTNLRIPHILRITKYHRDYFQHIYPVVVLQGKEIPIDCVTDQFNYEVPYSEKKDYPMDLQYLNGFDDTSGMGELGRAFKRLPKQANRKTAQQKKRPSLFQKLRAKAEEKKKAQGSKNNNGQSKPKKKGFFKKMLNVVNKINPATVLLRNGVLAAMKLNVKNVAGRLRWSYLTPEQAAQKGIDPSKFQRLVATREKLEKIFYGAGGNPKNLRKAMLGGKGNKDRAVAGLDGFEDLSGIDYLNVYTPLPQLLGPEIYRYENIEGMEGFSGLGQLGEPLSLASVGAAMGVIAGIVASLKQIGDIFKKKGEGSKDFDPQVNAAAEANQPVPGTTPVPEAEARQAAKEAMNNAQLPEASSPVSERTLLPAAASFAPANDVGAGGSQNSLLPLPSDNAAAEVSNAVAPMENIEAPATTTNALPTTTPPAPTKESYWEKNKSWLKPVAFGAGGIGLIAIGMAVLKPKSTESNSRAHTGRSLSGLPKSKKKNHKRKTKPKTNPNHKHGKKTAVALL